MHRRHQLPGEGDPHDLADGVGGEDPADPEPVGHLQGEGGLADSRGTAEEQDHGPLRLLETAPHEVALGGFGAVALPQRLVDEPPKGRAVHRPDTPAPDLSLDLPGHVVGVVGVEGGGEQRLGELALRKGQRFSLGAPGDLDAFRDQRARPLQVSEVLPADLRDEPGELLAAHLGAPFEAVPNAVGDLEGIVEGNSPRHQAVDHDAAHEGAPRTPVDDGGAGAATHASGDGLPGRHVPQPNPRGRGEREGAAARQNPEGFRPDSLEPAENRSFSLTRAGSGGYGPVRGRNPGGEVPCASLRGTSSSEAGR